MIVTKTQKLIALRGKIWLSKHLECRRWIPFYAILQDNKKWIRTKDMTEKMVLKLEQPFFLFF